MTRTEPNDTTPFDADHFIDVVNIGRFIAMKREAMGISQRELSRRASIANVSRIEAGQIPSPTTESLWSIADVLGITLAEVIAAGQPDALPALTPYLRTRYGQLPGEALADLERYVQQLTKEHGLDRTNLAGPRNGEDE